MLILLIDGRDLQDADATALCVSRDEPRVSSDVEKMKPMLLRVCKLCVSRSERVPPTADAEKYCCSSGSRNPGFAIGRVCVSSGSRSRKLTCEIQENEKLRGLGQ